MTNDGILAWLSVFLGMGMGNSFYQAVINRDKIHALVLSAGLALVCAGSIYKDSTILREFLQTIRPETAK